MSEQRAWQAWTTVAWLLTGLALTAPTATLETTDSISLRGHVVPLRLYGTRGGPPAIVSSGDGGWIHLAPHVAETLAARGYFVVGVDVRAHLSTFTTGHETLRPGDVPGDYRALADYAARGAPHKPVLVGVSEGAGRQAAIGVAMQVVGPDLVEGWEPRYLAYEGGLALPRVLADVSALVAGGYRRIFMR